MVLQKSRNVEFSDFRNNFCIFFVNIAESEKVLKSFSDFRGYLILHSAKIDLFYLKCLKF